MSEMIQNRPYRQQVLKDLIRRLHDGEDPAAVKADFEATFSGVSATEISEMEQALVRDGLPVEEIQRLCDIHAAVFQGSVAEIHRVVDPTQEPGHPVRVMKEENRAMEALVAGRVEPALSALETAAAGAGDAAPAFEALASALKALLAVDLHYSRKENLVFPFLERHGITTPPKVMWAVDDDIRKKLKKARDLALAGEDAAETLRIARMGLTQLLEMVPKEETILVPMLLENLSEDEWRQIAAEGPEIGYAFIPAPPAWPAAAQPAAASPAAPSAPAATSPEAPASGSSAPAGPGSPEPVASASRAVDAGLPDGKLRLPSGDLSLKEMTRILDTLPMDITFVDKEDIVRYFSQGRDRIFARTRTVLGRQVIHCHPPGSMHVVQTILDRFRNGEKDQEDFWIRMGPRYVLIRYFAVRDEAGEFLGTLEVTQDIAPIQALEGEKRLLD